MKIKLAIITLVLCICLCALLFIFPNYKEVSKMKVYVDSETNVMYLWEKSYERGDLSVMLKPNGSVLLHSNDSYYKVIYYISSTDIYVDSENNVMYFWKNEYNRGGLSIMLNPDGTPKIYNEKSIYKNVQYFTNDAIYIDEENDVMYLWKNGYQEGGLSVMLNPDGTSKTYEKDSMYKNINYIKSSEIYVDEENDLMYLWITELGKGGLSIMLNKDGTPKVFQEANSSYDQKKINYINQDDIYIEEEQGVMYFLKNDFKKSGLSFMLNPDGTAKVSK